MNGWDDGMWDADIMNEWMNGWMMGRWEWKMQERVEHIENRITTIQSVVIH